MKKHYRIQFFSGFILYLIGYNCQKEQKRLFEIFTQEGYEAGPYGQPALYFSIIAGVYCIYSFFVASKTAQRLLTFGTLWSIASLGMGIFAVAMFSIPREISIVKPFWIWMIYLAVGWGWAILAHERIDDAPLPQTIYEDEILDDL
jgi:hypothetical protein